MFALTPFQGVGDGPTATSKHANGSFDKFLGSAAPNHWKNNYLLAHLSHYVYDKEIDGVGGEGTDTQVFNQFADTFEDFYTPLGLKNFTGIHDDVTDTDAMVAETDNAVIVTFRGTDGNIDTILDLQVAGVIDGEENESGNGKGIHGGFAFAASSVLQDVHKAVIGPVQQGKKLWITGHSLGGAVAQATALFLADSVTEHCFGVPAAFACKSADSGLAPVKATGVVTFGQPRVFTSIPWEARDRFHSLFEVGERSSWTAQRG